MATLITDYANSRATLGPLSPHPEASEIDLCHRHANDLTVPAGWGLVRQPIPDSAWLETLADEIRRIGWRTSTSPSDGTPNPDGVIELRRKGHLRVIADASPPR